MYAEEVLGVTWWAKQQEIARAVLEHRRVFVKASHAVGKSFLAAGLVNWHYDCFDPSITLTTAPTAKQVDDVLWKEVRLQRMRRKSGGALDLMPKLSRMESGPGHYAEGATAVSGTAFQGRHAGHIGIIFDEAVAVDAAFWESTEGMTTSPEFWWLCICNPTDVSSAAYEYHRRESFHVITVSVLEHPNIIASLEGKPPPYPEAVSREWLENALKYETTPVTASDARPTDVEWPPGSGIWYRPNSWFESRALGRWPSAAMQSIWSEALWESTETPVPVAVPQEPLVIGCDVARHGDDYTSIVARRGDVAVHHETHNGWNTAETAGRLKVLARELAQHGENPRHVTVNVDDDGVGGGVVDQSDGFRFIGCSAGARANDPERYPNRRSEVWFAVAERANERRIRTGLLSQWSRRLLCQQAIAVRWKLDSAGRRVVEPKAEMKRRLKRSPDDMDAFNLAFAVERRADLFWLSAEEAGAAPVPAPGAEAPSANAWRLRAQRVCPRCMIEAGEGLRMHYEQEPTWDPAQPVHCQICGLSQIELFGPTVLRDWWWERGSGDVRA